MSKIHILTAVDYGDTCDGKARTIGVSFDRDEVQKILDGDIDEHLAALGPAYEEDCLSVVDKETGETRCEWNIEEMDIRLPLTPLQVTTLNGIAAELAKDTSHYADYENLTDEERTYLVENLKNTYHIDVTKEN